MTVERSDGVGYATHSSLPGTARRWSAAHSLLSAAAYMSRTRATHARQGSPTVAVGCFLRAHSFSSWEGETAQGEEKEGI